jgi:hypothetical protein
MLACTDSATSTHTGDAGDAAADLACTRAANSGYWDGKVHKAVKFGDPFDTRTVEGRKRAAQRAAHARRAKAEVDALRAEEESWSFWGAILRRFGRS